MGLVIVGLFGESSKVAISIFIFHLTSLTLLCTLLYFSTLLKMVLKPCSPLSEGP